MIRRKIDEHFFTCFTRKVNRRYHITIRRYDNNYIAIILIRICYNLCSKVNIRFFFLVGVDNIMTLEAL